MGWLNWNAHKFRNQHIVQELINIVLPQDPSALFLDKMWADEARLDELCDDLHFDKKWIVR